MIRSWNTFLGGWKHVITERFHSAYCKMIYLLYITISYSCQLNHHVHDSVKYVYPTVDCDSWVAFVYVSTVTALSRYSVSGDCVYSDALALYTFLYKLYYFMLKATMHEKYKQREKSIWNSKLYLCSSNAIYWFIPTPFEYTLTAAF